MKKLLITILLYAPIFAFSQGVFTAPQTSFKVVNGVTMPNAGATITVCAANASGIPCSPALVSTIFSNTALTQPLSNPFTADSTGSYQFAAAPGNYTVTETASGFVGKSYQITLTVPASSAGGLQDPGANGIVFRNGLNTTRIAVSADVIALFSGSCSVSTFIRGDGSCAAAAASFDQIGSGVNTSANMQAGSGSVVQPLHIGQVAASETWLAAGLSGTSVSYTSNSGGGLNTSGVTIKITFISAAGETLPSYAFSTTSSGPCASSTCQATVVAPTLPSGFTGYTVYSCQGAGCTPLKQAASPACVNITANCVISTIGAGSGVPIINTAWPQPANIQATNGPPGWIPAVFFPKDDGNFYPWLGVDFFPNDTPTGANGTPMITHRTFWNDIAGFSAEYTTQFQPYKNSLVSIAHRFGTGVATNNQDRALAAFGETPLNDTSTHYGLEALQSELFLSPASGFTINGSPDGEATTGSFQLNDSSSASWGGPASGENVLRLSWFKNGTNSNTIGGNVVNATFAVGTAGFQGGFQAVVYDATCTNSVGSTLSNVFCAGLKFNPAASRFANGQFGFWATNGSFTPGAGDYLIRNDIHNYPSLLNGTVGLNGLQMTDLAILPISASVTDTGSFQTAQIASSWTPGYSGSCSGGSSTYTYTFVAVDANGGTVASAALGNLTTCVNPLTVGNPATLNPGVAPLTTIFAQAARIDVYRTGGPMATGKVGSLSCNNDLPIFGCNAFVDSGLSASGSLPSGNTTGSIFAAGDMGFNQGKGQHFDAQAANNDFAGTLSVPASTTASVSFTRAYLNTPVCVLTPQTTGLTSWYLSAISTSGFTLTVAPSGTYTFGYICAGNPN